MTQTIEHCPLCGGTRSSLFDQREFRGQPVTNHLCRNCGLVYQSPRMGEAELAAFYEAEYRQLYQGGEGPNAKDLATQRGRADSLLRFVQGRVEKVSRLLDIGCSAGLLLEKFHENYGCHPVGIEPGAAYRKYAHKHGLKVFTSLEELPKKHEARFDLISIAHVLEHLPDPAAYLRGLRENLLEKGGWLLLEVPNLYAHDCFEVAHLVSYSAHTLTQVLHKAGFEIVSMSEHGKPRSEILPLYLTTLARPAPRAQDGTVIPERGVVRKRRIGMLRRRLLERLSPGRAWLPVIDTE